MNIQPKQSDVRPTVGRILHAYSDRWSGPRPAIVCNAWEGGPERNECNVNVFLDGANDRELLAELRQIGSGNTFCSVPVYDGDLDSQGRIDALFVAGTHQGGGLQATKVIAQWPPR